MTPEAYNDSLSENHRNRRDMFTVFNDQDNAFDIERLPNLDSITVKRSFFPDNELSNKKYIVDEVDKNYCRT